MGVCVCNLCMYIQKVQYLTDRPVFECINKIKAEITYPSDQRLYIYKLVVPSAITAASHQNRSHCISTTASSWSAHPYHPTTHIRIHSTQVIFANNNEKAPWPKSPRNNWFMFWKQTIKCCFKTIIVCTCTCHCCDMSIAIAQERNVEYGLVKAHIYEYAICNQVTACKHKLLMNYSLENSSIAVYSPIQFICLKEHYQPALTFSRLKS